MNSSKHQRVCNRRFLPSLHALYIAPFFVVVVAGMVLLAIEHDFFATKTEEASPGSPEMHDEPVDFTVAELSDLFWNDPYAAATSLKDKTVEVTGVVAEIDCDGKFFRNTVNVRLEPSTKRQVSIVCKFASYNKIVEDLEVGKPIMIRGSKVDATNSLEGVIAGKFVTGGTISLELKDNGTRPHLPEPDLSEENFVTLQDCAIVQLQDEHVTER